MEPKQQTKLSESLYQCSANKLVKLY